VADQKRWFKLWHSAMSDDGLMSKPPALRWAWAALGAHTKVHGTRGRVEISLSNAVLAAQIGVPVDTLLDTLKALPAIHVEEGNLDNGRVTVTWKNWLQYQEDSTVAERVFRLRSKRRGEEKRGEEKRNTPTPPVAEEVISHFNTTCQKSLVLTQERRDLILKRLAAGRTLDEMKTAITNFSKDDWPDRHKFMDLVYVIGVRNKIDNLDRWLTAKQKQEKATNGTPVWMNQ
jgi:hypothetical protein